MITNKYNKYIYDRYHDLVISGKQVFNNYDLTKIFEYYVCIKLSDQYKQTFYEYDDIDPTFKEDNKMTKRDTGIDCCNLIDTIVQCKLRSKILDWKECSTFFGSQNIFNSITKKTIVRWMNLIIARNNDCELSDNLKFRLDLFTDIKYDKHELIKYCNELKYDQLIEQNVDFQLRDYQIDCINLVKNNNKNVVICLPTGTGKNQIIINTINKDKKYLVLVPRIILMDQLYDEIIKFKPELKNHIQCIGDGCNKLNSKNIIICVYNSVSVVLKQEYDKIFIDEAHHIYIPEIYQNEDEFDISQFNDDNSENESFSDIVDDTEDEMRNTKNFVKLIRELKQHNNNVYLSATIDEIEDFEYYKKMKNIWPNYYH